MLGHLNLMMKHIWPRRFFFCFGTNRISVWIQIDGRSVPVGMCVRLIYAVARAGFFTGNASKETCPSCSMGQTYRVNQTILWWSSVDVTNASLALVTFIGLHRRMVSLLRIILCDGVMWRDKMFFYHAFLTFWWWCIIWCWFFQRFFRYLCKLFIILLG